MKKIYKYTTQKIFKFQILNMCYPCSHFVETGIFIDLVSFKDWAPLNTALSSKGPDHLAPGSRDPGRFLGSM